MIKKNLKLLTALFIFSVATAYFVITQRNSTLKKELSDFAVKDTSMIDKFFLADKSGKKVVLERNKENKWILNGKYIARQDVVNGFLTNISSLEVSSPISKNSFNNIVKQLASSGIKVELYSKEKIIKTFYVGGANKSSTGTYMMIENSSTPYVVSVSGFEGYLTPSFSCDELIWKETSIFNFTFKEIKAVAFTNFTKPEVSFTLEKNVENGFAKTNLKIANKVVSNFDTASANGYLMQFKNLNYEAVADLVSKTRRDSAINMPLFKISILLLSGENKSVTFYKKPVNKGTLDEAGHEIEYDIERMFAIVNEDKKIFYVVQYFVFDKLFIDGSSFIK